jgi:periplasmic divalent cation tolerance protein
VQANDKPILIYATFPSPQDAERIGAELVDCRLTACVNIIPGMTSICIWNDKRQHDSECVGIKTRQTLAEPRRPRRRFDVPMQQMTWRKEA